LHTLGRFQAGGIVFERGFNTDGPSLEGLFPERTTPTFTTETFGQAAGPIITDWEAAALFTKQQKKKTRNKYKSRSYGYEIPKAEMEIISTPKIGFERRNIGITHPIPQALLADPTGLMTQPFFAAMKSRDVIFYDERRNVRKRTAMVKLRRALRRRFQREVQEFLFAVRDVEFESDY
jgi:hypothetical protein